MTRFRHRLRVLQLHATIRRALRPDLIVPSGEGPDTTLRTFATTLAALVLLGLVLALGGK